MDFIKYGQKIEIAVGSESSPRVLRWITWEGGRNDLRVSYLLLTGDGGVLIDPVKIPLAGLDYLRGFANGFAAVVLTCANHDRDAKWFGNQVKAPVLVPQGIPSKVRKSTKRTYGDGALPGGLRAISCGHAGGEMWVYWRLGRKRLLFCGDTIYGQTEPDGFAGYKPKWWMQADGIRLYMGGTLSRAEMKKRYSGLLAVNPTEIFNGHNPRSISNAGAAIADVLEKGKLEVVQGAGTYLWRRWAKSGVGSKKR